MFKTKEKSGVTLIALVITIIVLLILASVSIAMLTGNNGILTQAKLAKENTAAAKEDEENRLANNNKYINEQLGSAVPGKVVTETKKDNYVDSNGDKATVPAGFTVSKIEEEQKVLEGLVIYDIPESEIANVDWTTKNEDGAYKVQTLYNQFVWIPVVNEEAYQRDLSYPDTYGGYLDTTVTDIGYLPNEIQPTPDNAIGNETSERKAALKYNGFYVARYEAGNENSSVVSKQNVSAYTNKTQSELKEIGKNMYDNTNVKSAMCSGIQWDTIMKFVNGKEDVSGNIYNVRTVEPNRHIEEKTETGKNEEDKIQNIYDLEGNCYEYVTEKNGSDYPFVFRGGNYKNNEYNKASLRGSSYGEEYSDITFRPVLYIM